MAFELKSEILTRISQTQDENMRIILLLLLGVMEHGADEIKKVGDKIDDLKRDEIALRKTVLNGLADTHHDDHLWLTDHRRFSEANQFLIDRAKPCMDWVEEQINLQEEAKQNRKSWLQKAFEGFFNQLGTILATALGTYIYFIK